MKFFDWLRKFYEKVCLAQFSVSQISILVKFHCEWTFSDLCCWHERKSAIRSWKHVTSIFYYIFKLDWEESSFHFSFPYFFVFKVCFLFLAMDFTLYIYFSSSENSWVEVSVRISEVSAVCTGCELPSFCPTVTNNGKKKND